MLNVSVYKYVCERNRKSEREKDYGIITAGTHKVLVTRMMHKKKDA